jgi:hypothetical protein
MGTRWLIGINYPKPSIPIVDSIKDPTGNTFNITDGVCGNCTGSFSFKEPDKNSVISTDTVNAFTFSVNDPLSGSGFLTPDPNIAVLVTGLLLLSTTRRKENQG